MSSRNEYLDDQERRAAMVLNQALLLARSAYDEGERNGSRLVELVRSTIESQVLARVDYVSLNDAETLEKLDKIDDRPALLSLAVFIGQTRLIDNIVLGQSQRNAATAIA
jgi:pantoate--beta-alanine ligase